MALHRYPDGSQGYVTEEEAKRLYNEEKKYRRGSVAPRYPVPATIYDAEYDLEYIWLLSEWARLEKELRDVRGDTNH